MAVPNQDPESKHTGNGSSTVFAYGFLLLAAGDLQVYVNGVLQTLGAHYTVSGVGTPSGGAVTFLAAPSNGVTVLLLRQVTASRSTDYQYAGDFQARVVNLDFDRLWMAIQDALARFASAIRFPRGENALNSILPRASLRARKAVIFDAQGNVTVSVDNYNEQASNAAGFAQQAKDARDATFGARDQVVQIRDTFADDADARLDDIEKQGEVILGSLGYMPPVTYAAGIVMSNARQTVSYSGSTYAPIADQLPFTTSGTFETTKFRLLQGVTGADLAAPNGSLLAGWIQSGSGAQPRTVQAKLRERVSLEDFFQIGEANFTGAFNRAFAKVRGAGGVIDFPMGGDIQLYGDVSSLYDGSGNIIENGPVELNGRSCTVRPVSASAPNSTIFRCYNQTTLGAGLDSRCTFRDMYVTGRLAGQTDADGFGVVNTCFDFQYCWTTLFGVEVHYAKRAGFYSKYGQYNKFRDCVFGSCVNDNGTYGVLLESVGDIEAANENRFINCRFNTNKNHVGVLGGIGNHFLSCQFQSQISGGRAGIVLDADGTGFGNNKTVIDSCYFEFNAKDIDLGVATSVSIKDCSFLDVFVTSTTCYGITIRDCLSYGATRGVTLAHPTGSGDVAWLTLEGNNFDASVNGVIHAAPSRMSYRNAATRMERNDNMLRTAGQAGTGAVPVVFADQVGSRSGIPRTVGLPIFSITQESFAAPALRSSEFKVILECINDEAASSAYGYCCRHEEFHVLVTNNNGTTQAFIDRLPNVGVDTGLSPGFASIGAINMGASVSGSTVTFSVAFPGAGSAPTTLTSMTCKYRIEYAGGNPVSFNRLT
ncbi:hypothetical protein [uncultured Pseudacidovorax sp.]|uniref:hypothetical protein n=1 Tax=uncultured Pseudacidovorax sp. TaxID=679313 RepID=UPI0025DE1FEB|nr:hypothetical protein [uncultured Pseudacidovorax sp.]